MTTYLNKKQMDNFFAATIERWYRENRRELPWRDTQDPYCIWVSEVILQQTRVAQGWDYYERFIRRFPTVEALAAASEDEVLLLWQGLGYYSRARHMHEAAQQVVALNGFPKCAAELRKLSGVGEYTAAAIASFAFGEACAVLDGNVFRVLSRYLGVDEAIDSTNGRKTFRALADTMLDEKNPALYNQAIMDFGAMVCTPQPQCAGCPLQETCAALRDHRQNELPVKQKAKQPKAIYITYIYAREGKRILLHRRGPNDIWQGLYEPPLASCTEEIPEGARHVIGGITHRLTHRLITCDLYLLDIVNENQKEWAYKLLREGYQWVDESARDGYAVPRLVEELYGYVG